MGVTMEVKERPILFQGEMVRAILEGRKTQTRRLNGLKEINEKPDYWSRCDIWDDHIKGDYIFMPPPEEHNYENPARNIICPYGIPGDRLWVREQTEWRGGTKFEYCVDRQPVHNPEGKFYGRRELGKRHGQRHRTSTVRASIHLPRWASRILLEITDIRVERVQDINHANALAEGMKNELDHFGQYPFQQRDQFGDLWNSINEKKGFGWDVNPWCWVVEFKKLDNSPNSTNNTCG